MKKLIPIFSFLILFGVFAFTTQSESFSPEAEITVQTNLQTADSPPVDFPFPPEGCGCIVVNSSGIWEIIAVRDCFSPCPGNAITPYPIPGLGY